MAGTKPLFLHDRELAAMKAEYHEASDKLPAPALEKMASAIRAKAEEISRIICAGADKHSCGSLTTGLKRRRGLFEVGCLDCGVRAQGETAEEAVYNWNQQDYYVKDESDNSLPIGKAVPEDPEEAE